MTLGSTWLQGLDVELIQTFPPDDAESGLGYYRRLAAENALYGWKELARECEVPGSRTGMLAQPEYIAARLGLEPAWTRHALAQEEVARGWSGLRRSLGDAVCPACLRDCASIRVEWEHVYCVACPRHQVRLLDHCENCGERFSINRERIHVCGCGTDITGMQTGRATPAQMWLASLIATQGASSGKWPPQVRDVAVDVLAQVVRTLCLHHDPTAPPARQNSTAPRTVSQAVEFLRPLDALLTDWPRGFEEHVSQRIAAGNPEARTLNALLGPWYLRLKAHSTGNSLAQFLESIGRVAAKEFNGLMGLDRAATAMSKTATHMLASHAAKLIGVHRETLVSHLQRGQVVHRTRKFGTRGTAYEIPIEEVEAIRTARSGWVSFHAASVLLGVPPTLVTRLAESGLVATDAHWRRDLRKGGPVSQDSLAQMIAAIKRHRVRPPQDEDAGRIRLGHLSGRRVGDQQAMARAVQAIVSGDIRPLARAKRVGDYVYSMLDVGRFFSTPLLEAGLSIQALSKLTGWKWEAISHWVDIGLLKFTPVTLRGQPSRVVMPVHLVEFSSVYVPLAAVAHQLGSKSSALAEKLQGIEILGAKPLPDGQRRGGLLRIADLAAIAVAYKKLGSTDRT
jgi:hypothetical protein